jgi:calcium-dependent protein kinase
MINLQKVKRLCNPAVVAGRYHLENQRSINTDYKVSTEVLGQGLCGNVVVACNRLDNKRYAVKTLSKDGVQEGKLMQLFAEVETHLSMDHPNIAHVKDVYESESSIFMVTECCEGGELYASLQDKGVYENAEAAEVTRQMMRVVRHLHARSIVHRDLKLENFLFLEKSPHCQMAKYLQEQQDSGDASARTEAPQLKLIDFGFVRVWDPAKKMMTACGSAEYVSPDVLAGEGYTEKTDMWSVGVVVWMLLAGYPPFHGPKKALMTKIKAGRPDWSHQSRWKHVSQDAKDFIQQLLVKDPQERLSAEAALHHPWLTALITKRDLSLQCDLGTVCSMQCYADGSKMRRAALQMVVQHLDSRETRQLRSSFFSLDQKSEGWISLEDFRMVMQQLEQTSNESPFQDGILENPEDLFAALDANGDHRIYYSEFVAATAKVCGRAHKHALKAAFARLDADNSGSVGINDLCTSLGKTFEGTDVALLLKEVQPQGGDMRYEDFVEIATLGHRSEDYDCISPTKGKCSFSLFASISTL